MLHYKLILVGALRFFTVPTAGNTIARACYINGYSITCPTFINEEDQNYCCVENDRAPYCCDFEEYVRIKSQKLGQEFDYMALGIVISAVVVTIIVTILSCLFCSCCYLAKRRVQRRVIYVPTSEAASISSPAYQQIHPPPASQVYTPSLHNTSSAAGLAPYNPYC